MNLRRNAKVVESYTSFDPPAPVGCWGLTLPNVASALCPSRSLPWETLALANPALRRRRPSRLGTYRWSRSLAGSADRDSTDGDRQVRCERRDSPSDGPQRRRASGVRGGRCVGYLTSSCCVTCSSGPTRAPATGTRQCANPWVSGIVPLALPGEIAEVVATIVRRGMGKKAQLDWRGNARGSRCRRRTRRDLSKSSRPS